MLHLFSRCNPASKRKGLCIKSSRSTPRSLLDNRVERMELFPPTSVRSILRPSYAWRFSNSSKTVTTLNAGTLPLVVSVPTTSNGQWRSKGHVRCATPTVRLEPPTMFPRSACQRSTNTLRGHTIHWLAPPPGLWRKFHTVY